MASNDEISLDVGADIPKTQQLIWEKDLLGVYVSGHPLDEYQDEMSKRPSISSIKQAVNEKQEIAVLRLKGELVTAGMIVDVRELMTKKGDRMAFVILGDQKDQIEMVVFPKTYTELRSILNVGACIAIKGKLSIRNDEPSIAVDKAKLFSGQATLASTEVTVWHFRQSD